MKQRLLLLFCLLLTCWAGAQAPVANFSASVTQGCSPLIVRFTNTSTGSPTAWQWDFGNGNSSTLRNPSASYVTPGTYTVTLTATNAAGSNTITRTALITVFDRPEPDFFVNKTEGCSPLRVQFTDASTAAPGTRNTGWLWDFGNGTQSTAQNPQTVYTTNGDYAVTLRVTNDKGCSRVLTRQNVVRVLGDLTAGFTAPAITQCEPPANVPFTNTSAGSGTLNYTWDFGDGRQSSDASPTHMYTTAGSYTVRLIVRSTSGCTDTVVQRNLVNLAQFNTIITAPDSACAAKQVQFTNTTNPAPTSALWNFGDNTTSNDINPRKTYDRVGVYTVTLTNRYGSCSETTTKQITITRGPKVSFGTRGDSARCQAPFTVNFMDSTVGGVSWLWRFGDGATSTQQNPTHTYTRADTFDVTLLVTDYLGCTDSLTRNNFIKIQPPVVRFDGVPAGGCAPYRHTFRATSNGESITNYEWDFGDGTTSSQATPSHTYTRVGIYNITLRYTTVGGCSGTITTNAGIKVGIQPTASFSFNPGSVCVDQPVTFTDNSNPADEWLWNFGDGALGSGRNPTHRYQDTGRFIPRLTAVYIGCSTSVTAPAPIEVKPPRANFGWVTDCNRNRLRFEFKDSSVQAQSHLWNFGDGSPSIAIREPVHIFPRFGTYNVSLTVTNGSCTHTFTRQVVVQNEDPDFTAVNPVACRIGTITLNAATNNPSAVAKYTWEVSGRAPVETTTPQFSPVFTANGRYSVRLVTTDINGCLDERLRTDYITIKGPTANFSAVNNRGCVGTTARFNDRSQTDGVSTINRWRFDFGDGVQQTFTSNTAITHTYNKPGTYAVKMVINDDGGCADSLSLIDTVFITNPTAAFDGDSLSCPNGTASFINKTDSARSASVWTFIPGGEVRTDNATYSFPATGVYSVKLKITDLFGCSDSITKQNFVTVDVPRASFTVSDTASFCAPFEVEFKNTSTFYTSSRWDFGIGFSTMQDPVAYYNTAGTYRPQLTITSPGGCTAAADAQIVLYDTAGTYIQYTPLNGCSPLDISLQAFNRAGPASFIWDFGDGVLIENGTDRATHQYKSFGDFLPTLILTDPTGCVVPVAGVDTVRVIGALADFGFDKNLLCDSGLIRFTDSTTFNNPIAQYRWTFGDGSTSGLQNPTHYYAQTGWYDLALYVTTAAGCRDSLLLPKAVKVAASPLISITSDSVICANDVVRHTAPFGRPDTSAVRWAWQFPNSNTSTQQNPPSQTYRTPGRFIVTAIATNSSGCADTAAQNFIVHALPEITLPGSVTVPVGFDYTLPATYSSGARSYQWTPVRQLSCADCPQPVLTPRFDTRYLVAVRDSNDCRDTAGIFVNVICPNANLFVPNTFTPNGDGSNDVLYVRGRGLERVQSFTVFNRWGEVVFISRNVPVNDPTFGWDGRYKGQKAPPGVYVYQLEVMCENNDILQTKGNVALIE